LETTIVLEESGEMTKDEYFHVKVIKKRDLLLPCGKASFLGILLEVNGGGRITAQPDNLSRQISKRDA